MEETRPIYVGTELKYLLNIETEGFSMDVDDFKIIIRSSHDTIEIPKSEMILTDNDEPVLYNYRQRQLEDVQYGGYGVLYP